MNRFKILIGFVSLILVRSTCLSQAYSFNAEHAKLLFGLSSSGNGSTIIAFAATESEGEDVTGKPLIIDFRSGKDIPIDKLETFASDPNASWMRQGKDVLFETVDGIYRLSIDGTNPVPKKVIAGPTHGLALSPSESNVAYWQIRDGMTSLLVRNLASGKVLRSWKLPLAYGSEAAGFEIAFIGEDRVYARTFDKPDSTPLKEFDMPSGKVKLMSSDCLSLTGSDGVLYYLSGDGPKGAIYELDQKGRGTRIVAAPFYTGIHATGSDWLVLTGPRGSGIFDLKAKQLMNQTSCGEVTMIDSNTRIYEKRNLLSSDPGICKSHPTKPKSH